MPRSSSPSEPVEAPRKPGTVTRIQTQKKNTDRVSVFLDGQFAFGLAVDVATEAGLRKGEVLSVEAQEGLLAADERVRARLVAVAYIAYQARTEHQVRQKLRRSGFSERAQDEAVQRMHELGYLDDAAYARAYARGRFAGRGHGPQRIRADLMKKGLRGAVIDDALDTLGGDADYLGAALHHGRRRWARLQREEDPYRRRQKLTSFLQRRGFDFDTIRTVLDRLEREAEEE